MAKFTIYSKDGKVRYEGEPQYSGSYMSVDYLEFRSISSPCIIDWERGDYVDYYRTGLRYKLYSHPMPKKVARKGEYGGAIEYSNVQFFAATKELEIAPFRDLVPEDNKIHFSTRPEVSTYENVYGVARRIQECVNDIYPGRWRIEVYDTDDADLLALFNETKEYSISNGSCLDALSQIYDTWKNVGWIHTYDSANDVDVITIGRANVRNAENTSDSFRYGMGNGLTSIKKAAANEGEFATRLYVYGSERNIQTRYYNGQDILYKDSVDIRNLMLPLSEWGKTDGLPDARKAYIQAEDSIIEKYGLIPRTIYFDGSQNEEIYPSITGLTQSDVRRVMIEYGQQGNEYLPKDLGNRIDKVVSASANDAGDKESLEKNRTFEMTVRNVGFNIAEQGKLTAEGKAKLSIKSGKCAGREFVVNKCAFVKADDTLVLKLERAWDDSIGMGYPNLTYPIGEGDEFVLLDIPMPDYYIYLAEERLLEAGRKMLDDYTRVSAFYEPGINAIKIKEGGKILRAGMYMQIYDEDIIETEDNTDYVLIDTLTIDEKAELPAYRVTLREQKRSARNFAALEEMIEDAKDTTKQEIAKSRQYTDRRFNSAQETLDMLSSAFKGFSEGISPITVKTMAMLVGDESNQFKFTKSLNTLEDADCPLVYDISTKQLKAEQVSYIKHMTLGIDAVTTKGVRSASDYIGWNVDTFYSEIFEDTEARYVYIKASKSDNSAEFVLSKVAIDMESEVGYYHFLVGILNLEYNGTRDFVTLYGFTEVLPGQITTDILRSGNGNLVIDLVNALITARNGATIKGNVTIEEGSIISSRMDVGDPKTGTIEAFFNGGDFAEDNAHGKMIIAGGIPEKTISGDADIEKRAGEAATRIYEDGYIDTNNIKATGGVFSNVKVLGSSRSPFVEGALMIENEVEDNHYNLNADEAYGVELQTDISNSGRIITLVGNFTVKCVDGYIYDNGKSFYNTETYVGPCASWEGIVGAGLPNIGFEIVRLMAVSTSPTKVAWMVIERRPFGASDLSTVNQYGMFAGLRPMTKIINEAGEYTLSRLDHTVIISFSTSGATVTLNLEGWPEQGQTYEIYNTDADHDVIIVPLGDEANPAPNIYSLSAGEETSRLEFKEAHRRHITLIFDGARWLMSYRNLS